MSDYTPTTEKVRSVYINYGHPEPLIRAEIAGYFDQWLAQHDAAKDARIAELEAKLAEAREFRETYHEQWMLNAAAIRRVEALADHDGTVFTDDIREALKDDSDD